MIACKCGHVGVVKEILERGGDKVDVNRVRTGSALTNACDSGNMEVLELLLNHPKIDVTLRLDRVRRYFTMFVTTTNFLNCNDSFNFPP